MKFDKSTLDILKNFSTINNGMWFRKGDMQNTVALSKSIFARAKIDFGFNQEFGIFDLATFINIVSLYDDVDIEIGDNKIVITGDKTYKVNFITSPKEVLITTDKEIQIKEVFVDFDLPLNIFQTVRKNADLMKLKNLIVEIKDGDLILSATNLEDNTETNSFEYKLDSGLNTSDAKFAYSFENMQMLSRDYKVSITDKGLTRFEADDIEYYLAPKAIK